MGAVAATTIKLAVDKIPSLAPSTPAHNHPVWESLCPPYELPVHAFANDSHVGDFS